MTPAPTSARTAWPGGGQSGEPRTLRREVRGYLLGLALAVGLTIASFWVVDTN